MPAARLLQRFFSEHLHGRIDISAANSVLCCLERYAVKSCFLKARHKFIFTYLIGTYEAFHFNVYSILTS